MFPRCSVVAALVLVCSTGGCQRGPTPVPVKGTVQYRVAPSKTGKIYSVNPGAPPTVLDIVDGQFEGKMLPESRRVELRAYRQFEPAPAPGEGPMEYVTNDLPEKYGNASTLTVEVTEEGPNEFTFTLER